MKASIVATRDSPRLLLVTVTHRFILFNTTMEQRKLKVEEQDWVETMANRAAKYLKLIDEQGAILRQDIASMNASYDSFKNHPGTSPIGWRPPKEEMNRYVKELEEFCARPATEPIE